MNRKIDFVKKFSLSVLIALFVASIVPAQSSAYTLDVKNPYNDRMSVAIVDFEDAAGKWRTHGWFEVKPLSSRRIQMPTSTLRKNIYLYVETSEASWSGEGYPSSITRTVISNAFSYYDGQAAPNGPRRRDVMFVKYELENGFLVWTPE